MKVTAISIVAKPHDWTSGDRLLAFFSVEFAGMQLRDCQLIRGVRTKSIIAIPPKGENRIGERAIRFIDPEIQSAVAAAAYQAFLALGGVESESGKHSAA